MSDPYRDFQLQLQTKLNKQKEKEEAEKVRLAEVKRKAMDAAKKKALPDTVGKYMKSDLSSQKSHREESIDEAPKSKKIKSGGFNNFDAF